MRAECVREKLHSAITQAERVTGKNLALPILGSLLLEAKEKTIMVRATNLEIGLEIEIPAKISERGKVAVSGALMSNFLGAVSGGDVLKIALESEVVSLSTRTTQSRIKTLPTEDFPTLPRVSEVNTMLLPALKFTQAIRSVAYAASASDMKPEIASVYIYTEDGSVVFVATDSFRLAEKRFDYKEKEQKGEPPSLIVPYKNILEISRLFESVQEPVFLQFSKNQLSCTAHESGIYVTSRLVGGMFPNYQQIVSKEKTTEVVVAKKELMAGLKLANVFSDKFNQVTFHLAPADGVVELQAQSGENGETKCKLDATIEGEALSVSFNTKYVLDCFASLTEETVSLTFNGPLKPMVVRGLGDRSFFYLVMPLNR